MFIRVMLRVKKARVVYSDQLALGTDDLAYR